MKNITYLPEVTHIMLTEKSSPTARDNVASLTIVFVTALVLGLGITFYWERHSQWARFSPSSAGTLEEDWSM
jgi:hypothetical protein